MRIMMRGNQRLSSTHAVKDGGGGATYSRKVELANKHESPESIAGVFVFYAIMSA
jgi:hypothetical protein